MTTQDGGFCMAMIGQHILDGGLTYVLCMISSLYSYFLLISRKLDNISASTWTKTGIFWPSKYRTYIHLLTKERLDVYPYWMLLKLYPIFMCLVGIRPWTTNHLQPLGLTVTNSGILVTCSGWFCFCSFPLFYLEWSSRFPSSPSIFWSTFVMFCQCTIYWSIWQDEWINILSKELFRAFRLTNTSRAIGEPQAPFNVDRICGTFLHQFNHSIPTPQINGIYKNPWADAPHLDEHY